MGKKQKYEKLMWKCIGVSLMTFGAAVALSCGVMYGGPYVHMQHMQPAQCRIVSQEVPTDRHNWRQTYVPCRCELDDDKCDPNEDIIVNHLDRHCTAGLCYSYFPCLNVTVSFTGAKGKVNMTTAYLYKNYLTYRRSSSDLLLSELGEKCYMSPCRQYVGENEEPVIEASKESKIQPGEEFECFYDVDDPEKVVMWRPRFYQIIVGTAVPAGFILIGAIITIWACHCCRCGYKQVPDEEDEEPDSVI